MKKLYFFFFLLCSFVHAQTINFPDANLKLALVQGGYDTNSDGNIQLSEAQAVTNLNLYEVSGYPITSLAGLENFSNTTQFFPNGFYAITSVDLSIFPLLEGTVFSNWSTLTTVNTTGLTHLKGIMIMNCPNLSSLPMTGLSAIENINIMGANSLVNMDFTPCTNLNWLRCEGLTSLNASGLQYLTYIDTYGSDTLTTLNVTGCIALEQIDAWHSHIENLDVSGLTALKKIDLQVATPGFPPTNLNATGCTSLEFINSMSGNLGTVNLSGCTAFKELRADMNHITQLDITGCTALQKLYLTGNELTTIDVSHCTQLTTLDVTQNPMATIFCKNGIDEHLQFYNWPVSPTFICADENDIPGFSFILDPEQTICSPYCTFEPGGNYNTITGTVKVDLNGDGCGALDIPMGSVRVGYDNGTDQFAAFSNYSGQFLLYAHAGTMTPVATVQNPEYWNISSSSSVTFAAEDSSTEVRDFCITPNGVHPDIEVSIISMLPARPGFDAEYTIIMKNKGNQTIASSMSFSFNDDLMDVVETQPTLDSQTTGNIVWNYSNFLPFETRTFYVKMNVNAPTDTPSVNIDDVLHFVANSLVAGDDTVIDNSFAFDQIVVGSFDPNDKHCMNGAIVPTSQIGGYLTYVINFENTGTFPAENVVIKDLLDADKFDLDSIQILGASDQKTVTITGNRLEIFFENINLMPNEYGYVAFKIKTNAQLIAGATVENKASIYFDFNFPVETNIATTTFQNLGVGQFDANVAVRIFPNPARNTVYVRSESKIANISITDLQGRIVKQIKADSNEHAFDVSGFAAGVYAVKVATDSCTVSQKLMVR